MWEGNTNKEKLQIRKIFTNNKDIIINRRITAFNNLKDHPLNAKINAKQTKHYQQLLELLPLSELLAK